MATQAMDAVAVDSQKKELFAERMLRVWNDAFLSLMISIGHRTRLFDSLAGLPPSTSAQIATASGLKERYVREWLAAMTSARIVDYHARQGTYSLPPHHAACLTRAAGLDNMAQFTQYVAMLGAVEEQVVHSFRHGGGVPFSAYPRFQELHEEETHPLFDALLVDTIVPLVPGLVDRLERGADVLDIGCGAGYALFLLAQAFPRSRLAGYDLSPEGIAMGQAEAARRGLTNVRFAVRDSQELREPRSYDLITAFNAIHDLGQPTRTVKLIYEALRPGGAFLMQDIAGSSHLHENLDHPLATVFYTASTMLCMTTSLAQGGEGLGTMWGEQKARQILAEAGFTDVVVKRIPADTFNNYYVATK